MKHSITLPSGARVTAGQYVEAWRLAAELMPNADVRGWAWFPVTAGDVLRDISEGVHDRINRHLPALFSKRSPEARLARRIALGLIQRACKWCGTLFKPESLHNHVCSPDCGRALYN